VKPPEIQLLRKKAIETQYRTLARLILSTSRRVRIIIPRPNHATVGKCQAALIVLLKNNSLPNVLGKSFLSSKGMMRSLSPSNECNIPIINIRNAASSSNLGPFG